MNPVDFVEQIAVKGVGKGDAFCFDEEVGIPIQENAD